jgi:uncharacterized protein YjdB
VLAIGQQQQYTATVVDSAGDPVTGTTLTWTSSEPAVATIDPSGLAVAVTVGGTAVTASASGVTSNAATLQVVEKPIATVEVTPTQATIAVGQTQPFTAVARDADGDPISGVTFAWTSGDTDIATVDDSGLAHGVAPGTTSVTAETAGPMSASATIVVASHADWLRLVLALDDFLDD